MISFLFARHAVFGMIAAMTSARKDARMSISTPVASIVPPYLEERLGDAAAAIDTGDMGKLRTAADCYVTVLQSPSQFERHGLSESDQVELQNDPYVVSSWEVMLDQLTVHREFERALSLAIQTMPKHRQPHGDTALVTLASGRCPPLVETLSEKAPIRTIQEIRDAFEATSVDTTRFRVLSGMYDRAVKIYFNRNPKNAFAMLRKAISSTSPDGLAVQAAQTLRDVTERHMQVDPKTVLDHLRHTIQPRGYCGPGPMAHHTAPSFLRHARTFFAANPESTMEILPSALSECLLYRKDQAMSLDLAEVLALLPQSFSEYPFESFESMKLITYHDKRNGADRTEAALMLLGHGPRLFKLSADPEPALDGMSAALGALPATHSRRRLAAILLLRHARRVKPGRERVALWPVCHSLQYPEQLKPSTQRYAIRFFDRLTTKLRERNPEAALHSMSGVLYSTPHGGVLESSIAKHMLEIAVDPRMKRKSFSSYVSYGMTNLTERFDEISDFGRRARDILEQINKRKEQESLSKPPVTPMRPQDFVGRFVVATPCQPSR